jgi:predicted house-cleaning noncanonical NTP pyrophosphatase (MazG superfamily)
MKKYDKLVRDRIPEIIERAGKAATWRRLRDVEFRLALKAKALEEAQELFVRRKTKTEAPSRSAYSLNRWTTRTWLP